MLKFLLPLLTLADLLLGCSRPSHDASANELIHESSPYLLQHAHNPVHWHPWSDKALAKAKAEGKLLIVSVGYASCHWCHVMERESFEDTTVARLMNEYFLPIKVDREERPDVDDVYMNACQLSSESGCGWPLNAFALPDGRPVWTGSYLPKENWLEVLQFFKDEWKNNPDKIKDFAEKLAAGVQQMNPVPGAGRQQDFAQPTLDSLAQAMLAQVDFERGGLGQAPKFPLPASYQFLLQYQHLTGDKKALQAVIVTLDRMALGGIYDHLGGGFARYSTDAEWKVPHFEKMLYDNAQLVSLYAAAFQATGKPLYRRVAEESVGFVQQELASPEGAFYSSLDADTEGEEGKYYVWQQSEIEAALGDAKLAALVSAHFNISPAGNWEAGKNILHSSAAPTEAFAKKHGMGLAELESALAGARQKLLAARQSRPKPALDDKALTAWNALMLKALTDAYRAFGTVAYRDAALKNGQFLLEKMMQPDGRLFRNYKAGKASVNGFLDDYALCAEAFLSLYQITFDERWLTAAKRLTEHALLHFHDPKTGLFFYTSDLDPPLYTRRMETSDGVIPASNSVMGKNLLTLGLLYANDEWVRQAKGMMKQAAPSAAQMQQAQFYANWSQLCLLLVRPPYEVAIVGEDFDAKLQQLSKNYLPHALLLGGKTEGSLALLEDKLQEGQTMIYVCMNRVCKLPTEEVGKALELMK